MAKAIPNPLDAEANPTDYERRIGDIIADQMSRDPDWLKSMFRSWIDDPESVEALAGLRMHRRTSDKPRWRGASGYAHQIDESFSTDDESVVLLVEGKHRRGCIGIPEFCTLLVRMMDIKSDMQDRTVLGMLVTTQGSQGRAGGREEDRSAIGKLQAYFSKSGYPIAIQVLPDYI